MAVHSPGRKNGGDMQIEVDAEVSLFVRDPATGRFVFNSKAIEALGLSPTELAQRGYPLDCGVASPATVPEEQPRSPFANG